MFTMIVRIGSDIFFCYFGVYISFTGYYVGTYVYSIIE